MRKRPAFFEKGWGGRRELVRHALKTVNERVQCAMRTTSRNSRNYLVGMTSIIREFEKNI